MTDNMKYIVNTVTSMINSKFGDELPNMRRQKQSAQRFLLFILLLMRSLLKLKLHYPQIFSIPLEWQLHCVVVILHTSRGILFRKMMGSIGTDIRII